MISFFLLILLYFRIGVLIYVGEKCSERVLAISCRAKR